MLGNFENVGSFLKECNGTKLRYDQACLQLETSKEITFWSQYEECEDCMLLHTTTVSSSEALVLDTSSPLRYSIRKETEEICNGTYQFGEYGQYNINLTEPMQHDCMPRMIAEPDAAYLPILSAVVVLLSMATLWYIVKGIGKYIVASRFYGRHFARISSKNSRDYYEPSDSENEYTIAEKKLLEKARKSKHNDLDSEEEVYGFSSSEDESGEKNEDFDLANSDVEGQENSEEDLPNSKAWGKKKSSYYSTDYVDQDYGGFGEEEEEEAALMEGAETTTIMKNLLDPYEQIDQEFGLINDKAHSLESDRSNVLKNAGFLDGKEKAQTLVDKEDSEYTFFVEDFKSKLTVAKDNLQPFLKLMKEIKLADCPVLKFVQTFYEVILNYCTNISFYFLLRCKNNQKPNNYHNHPVIKRLLQYRQMLNKLEPIYLESVKPQIEKILHAEQNNIKWRIIITNDVRKRKSEKLVEPSSKRLKTKALDEQGNEDTKVSDEDKYKKDDEDTEISDEDEYDQDFMQTSDTADRSVELVGNEKTQAKQMEKNNSETLQMQTDILEDKRGITYQIAKNKGLTPRRKKEQRNPRVKHKLKYRKAKIRRKGAVREHKVEISRYSGEATGIKANVKKGIKIK